LVMLPSAGRISRAARGNEMDVSACARATGVPRNGSHVRGVRSPAVSERSVFSWVAFSSSLRSATYLETSRSPRVSRPSHADSVAWIVGAIDTVGFWSKTRAALRVHAHAAVRADASSEGYIVKEKKCENKVRTRFLSVILKLKSCLNLFEVNGLSRVQKRHIQVRRARQTRTTPIPIAPRSRRCRSVPHRAPSRLLE
jgi:hypothetical protein